MLRRFRIIGILVFVALATVSANRLRGLYCSGTLFEPYNSSRRTNTTLLAFSILGLAALGYFELTRSRRHRMRRRSYGHAKVENPPVLDEPGSTCIYSAPDTPGKRGRQRRSSVGFPQRESTGFRRFWMGLLRVYSIATPGIYAFLLAACLSGWMPVDIDMPVLAGLFGSILLLSLTTSVGLLLRKSWGIGCGYAMAIIHLLVFPFGTASGLILLVALAGASPLFLEARRERQRAAREKRRRKVHAAGNA